ncbi:MAG: glycosyltransferase family 2 protein [Planctomycetes bacterium]|nr:glycosyltransferase family 2 protein [Planctomycetota bacterium]
MKLTIVIPAFNEEEAIGATIERCIAARESIIADSPVTDVEIIVVSDGSTDRTAAIAGSYSGVRLIVFEHNRGYGAAIQRGFEACTGQIVGFLDADGTCDPRFFATLCTALVEEDAAVALGSRLGQSSRMPRIRRWGNRLYAFLLSILSNRVVTDTASGMRVIRRDLLPQLYPLPDGLHFTPAMSARVLMDEKLTIVERPMSYEERMGESKLSVMRDGVRFLRTILEMTLMWRPARLFMVTALACLTLALVLAGHPLETWLRLGRFDEGMIYRLLFCSLLGTIGIGALSAGVVAQQLHCLIAPRRGTPTFAASVLDRVYTLPGFAVCAAHSTPVLWWLVGEGIWTRVTSGVVTLHWSRVVLAGLIVFGLAGMLATILLANIIRFHAARRTSERPRLLGRQAAPLESVPRPRSAPASRPIYADVSRNPASEGGGASASQARP